jgi:phage terminase large subunit-like protein
MLQRRRSVGTFADFAREYNAGHATNVMDYEHTPALADAAEQVCRGYIDRLMVLMPPRYFKSEIFSRLLPAFYLHRYPTRNVGLASYSASLAWDLSDDAREYYRESGGETATETDAKRQWANSQGGEMWAEGVGGSLTGRGFDLGVIDDPIKPEEARSKAVTENFRSWYASTWHNRMEPGGQMIVVMQRLSESDPIDFLLRREVGDRTDKAPEHWTVLCLGEYKSEEPLADFGGPKGLPETCTLIDDGREVGKILAPSRFDEGEVINRQRGAGADMDAQRQQRPSAPSGDFWRESWFEVFGDPAHAPREDLPSGAEAHGKDWDTAYTDDERNSASSYVDSCHTWEGDTLHVWVYGCGWRWLEFPDLIAWMERVEGPHYIEAKASGKSASQSLDRADVKAEEVEVSGGDKYARASGVQGMVGSKKHGGTGRVHVHASVYEKLLRGERQGLLRVQADALADGDGDLDLNDCFVQALNRHQEHKNRAAFTGRTITL